MNYFFLWNYNKLPFVYSIMKENEKNILIINIHDCPEMEATLSGLQDLSRIHKIYFIKNNFQECLFNIFYRVFIYPFKIKKEKINFYLDGFVDFYPIYLANIGTPDQVYFYEEGESIYQDNVLFVKEKNGLKSKLGDVVKKLLFIKKNSIYGISVFYVRDKIRLLNAIENKMSSGFSFLIEEVDDVEYIKNMPISDKNVIEKVFFVDQCFEVFKSQSKTQKKRAIILTQPTYLYGLHSKDEIAGIFNCYIRNLINENYDVFLKLHPSEREDLYLLNNVKRINGRFPFEFLAIFNVIFDLGVTYNSTAIKSSLIRDKLLIQDLSC